MLAGFRPHTTRSFCFGKRTQNQGRPGAALAFLVIPGLIGDPGLLSLRTEEKEKTLDPRMRKDDRKGRRIRDRGAAAPAGALTWRHGMARYESTGKVGGALDAAPTTTEEGKGQGKKRGGDGNSGTGLGVCFICTERVHWFDPFGGDA